MVRTLAIQVSGSGFLVTAGFSLSSVLPHTIEHAFSVTLDCGVKTCVCCDYNMFYCYMNAFIMWILVLAFIHCDHRNGFTPINKALVSVVSGDLLFHRQVEL